MDNTGQTNDGIRRTAGHWQIVNNGSNIVSSDPKSLWQNAAKYFKWCDDNPIIQHIPIRTGKRAGTVDTFESPRPYTLKGLCLHCNILEEWLRDIRQTQEKNSEYYIVVSKILYLIYVQNQEYATTGIFNPIFTAKILNVEKDETPVSAITVNIVQGLPELAESENEVLEKLESEIQLFEKGSDLKP